MNRTDAVGLNHSRLSSKRRVAQQAAPSISVIIPVHNGSVTIKSCLEAVLASDYLSYECIVVDDGSVDDSAAIARQFAAHVLELPEGPFGPAHARNRGAEAARAAVIFFVDADVVLAPGALRHVAKLFQEQPDLAAVFGSYDARPRAAGVISQYRNLLHHFVHQNGNPEASTFWAGCGAIRRSVFEEVGRFDENLFQRPSIEDIELGYRLRQLGYRIVLDKELQGTHLKRWSLYSLIRTDISCRALPWSRLIVKTRQIPDDLNLKLGQRLSFALVAVAAACLALAIVEPELLMVSAAALLGVAVINRKLYVFFFRQRGIWFACLCVALQFVYYLYSGISFLSVWLHFHVKRVAATCTRPRAAGSAVIFNTVKKPRR